MGVTMFTLSLELAKQTAQLLMFSLFKDGFGPEDGMEISFKVPYNLVLKSLIPMAGKTLDVTAIAYHLIK